MAKIKVTKVNFTSKVKESLNNGLLGSFFGEEIEKTIGNLPNEQEIWIDTDEIRQIDTLIVEGAFKVHYKGETESKGSVDIKAECFDDLLKAWKGE